LSVDNTPKIKKFDKTENKQKFRFSLLDRCIKTGYFLKKIPDLFNQKQEKLG
jgi:hypothetical protein